MSHSVRLRELSATKVVVDTWRKTPPTPLYMAFPFPWHNTAAQELHSLLEQLFPDLKAVSSLAQSVGIDMGHVDTSGAITFVWRAVLDSSVNQGKLQALIEAAATKLEYVAPQERCNTCGRQVTGEKKCRECRGAPSRLAELLPLGLGTLGQKVADHLATFIYNSRPSEAAANAATILAALAKLEDDGIDAFLVRLTGQALPDPGHTSLEPLAKLLMRAYSNESTARYCAMCVGVNLDRVDQRSAIDPLWRGILQAAENQGKLLALVRAAVNDPQIAGFHSSIRQWMISQDLS